MDSLQKKARIESPKYLKWIREQPCAFCGGQSEPHHLRSVGLGTGTGYKASDILTIPVCRNHHEQCHNGMLDNEFQMMHCLRTINKALAAGVIEIK